MFIFDNFYETIPNSNPSTITALSIQRIHLIYSRRAVHSGEWFECERSNANWDRSKRVWDRSKRVWIQNTFSRRTEIDLILWMTRSPVSKSTNMHHTILYNKLYFMRVTLLQMNAQVFFHVTLHTIPQNAQLTSS